MKLQGDFGPLEGASAVACSELAIFFLISKLQDFALFLLPGGSRLNPLFLPSMSCLDKVSSLWEPLAKCDWRPPPPQGTVLPSWLN